MRLRLIQKILKSSIDLLKPNGQYITGTDNPRYYLFQNGNDLRKGILEISKTELFEKETSEMLSSSLFASKDTQSKIVEREYNRINVILTDLTKQAQNLLEALNKILPIEDENIIGIKLPDIKDFDDTVKLFQDLEKIIKYPVIDSNPSGNVQIVAFDTGSFWIDVYLASQAAVTLIGGIAWAAAVVFKKIQEGRLNKEFVRGIKVKNDAIEHIAEALKIHVDMLVDNEAKHLYFEHYVHKYEPIVLESITEDADSKENREQPKTDKDEYEINIDNEKYERLKLSIRTLAELIDKGTEIHPSLKAPETVSNLFPNFQQLGSIVSKVAQIAAKSESSGTNEKNN